MRNSQQQMEHLSRLSILGELAGRLAHELNQPLAAIANYARSLLRRQERGSLSAEALGQAAPNLQYFQQGQAAGGRIFEIMKRKPVIDLDADGGYSGGVEWWSSGVQ